MEFNPGKCQVIHVTRSRSPLPTTYMLHNQTLEVVPCARYLGVDISHDLSWKPNINRITGNANRSLGFLRRNLKAKNLQLRERAYKAIVRPQLEYAAPVWDPHTQDDINKNEMVQRRAAQWVLNDYSHTQAFRTCWSNSTGIPSSSGEQTPDWSYFIKLSMAT